MGRKDLEFDGIPEYHKSRKLKQTVGGSIVIDHQQDKQNENPFDDSRSKATTDLFQDLAQTYLKGEKVKEGLALMNPLDSIPIEEDAVKVSSAASRQYLEESSKGSRITYNMFQKAVNSICESKWKFRRTYLDANKIPTGTESQTSYYTKTFKSKGKYQDYLSEFFSGSGIAGAVLAAFTISPFQNIIFQGLTLEEISKGIALAQVPLGIVILLEVGIKAEQIRKVLKQSKLDTKVLDPIITDLENNKESRKKALADNGIDYESFVANQEVTDAQVIVEYVSDFFSRNAGIMSGHKTIDHWLAYLHVSLNQNLVRGALNTSSEFSATFSEMLTPGISKEPTSEKQTVIHSAFASNVRGLVRISNKTYDTIVNSFLYQITDQDMCCLVQILGAIDPDMLRTISTILKICAADLAADIMTLNSVLRRALSNVFRDAIYEIVAQLNKFYDKVLRKLIEAFNYTPKGIEACGGLLSVGLSLIWAWKTLELNINSLLSDILSQIFEFGTPQYSHWGLSAERRHLLSIASILDIMAEKLAVASVCDQNHNSIPRINISDVKDAAAGEVINTIIKGGSPSIQLSDKDISKYFPNLTQETSEKFGFSYGFKRVNSQSISNKDDRDVPCEGSKESNKGILDLIEQMKNAFKSAN